MRAEPGTRPRNVQGAAVGILMLDTRFGRIRGDVGNARTWPFPVLYSVVRDATVQSVHGGDQDALLAAFIAAGRELVETGADGLVTSCGFLTPFQRAMADGCGVPVAVSPLLQHRWVRELLPAPAEVGILTARRSLLTRRHLEAVGIPADAPVEGLDTGREFSRIFLDDGTGPVDVRKVEREMVAAARRLVDRHPKVGALVLECANMAPYSARLNHEFGLPVHDIYSLVTWFQAGLCPRRFGPEPE